MKNNRLLFLLLLLIAVGGGVYYWSGSSTDFLKYERNFAIKNFQDIRKIFVAKRLNGYHFILEKGDDGRWTVDGMPANQTVVKGMLATLHDLTIQYKPPRKAYLNVMHNLANHAMKIEVYDKDGNNMKTIYLGGTPPDSYGTYAMLAGSDQPFVIHKKLTDGDVRAVFDLTIDRLRDPFIFPYKPSQIKEVTVEYPYAEGDGFRIQQKAGQSLVISPLAPGASGPTGSEPNQSLLEDYLYHFGKVEVEGFINKNPIRDTLSNVVPFANVHLSTGDKSIVIQVFPFNADKGKIDIKGYSPTSPDFFRYVCKVNDNDLVLVQRPLIEKIFAKYPDFFVMRK